VKLPAEVRSGVVHHDHFYAVTQDGHLIAVDLKKQAVKDYGTLDTKLAPFVDVADGKACVASPGKIYLVDLGNGKVARTLDAPKDLQGASFIGAERICLSTHAAVLILDLKTGKASEVAGLGEKSKSLLYEIGSARIVGERAFVVRLLCSYGVWIVDDFGWIDLKTRKYTALERPRQLLHASGLVSGPGGTLLLTAPEGTFQYDAEGKHLRTLTVKTGGRVVGLWRSQALVTDATSLHLVSPETVTAKVK
jgi:hypothetical protein